MKFLLSMQNEISAYYTKWALFKIRFSLSICVPNSAAGENFFGIYLEWDFRLAYKMGFCLVYSHLKWDKSPLPKEWDKGWEVKMG